MPRDKVILAYSGGLDTSVMVPWIGEKYNLDVVAFTVDLGQGEDIEKIRQKALRTGAVDAVALDARNLFVDCFVWPALRAGAADVGAGAGGSSPSINGVALGALACQAPRRISSGVMRTSSTVVTPSTPSFCAAV